jgi:hypothetical protein
VEPERLRDVEGIVSEFQGEGEPIPFVKIYGTPLVAPQPTVRVHDDVFLLVELVNMGTACTRPGDEVTGYLSYGNGVVKQETVNLPAIEPNGGSWRHTFHFEGRFVMIDGEWMAGAMVTNEGTIGEVQDDQRVTFHVSPREADPGF